MKRNENFKVSPMPASIVPVARKGCRSFADFATTALQVCTTHTTHNQPPTEITHHEGKRHDTRHQVPCSIGGKVSPRSSSMQSFFKKRTPLNIYEIKFGFTDPPLIC